jgi:hypothetical protein
VNIQQVPPAFQFSQASLQTFVDCPRRFWLRYVQRLAWPAAVAEPSLEYEQHIEQGAAFHRLAHQHALGIPAARLTRLAAADDDLARWWDNYLQHPPADLPPQRYPEVTLTAPVSGRRLLAKYDLLAVEPGARAVIVDWKTSRRRPAREKLARRLQTRVYPYVLAAGAGAHLNGGEPFAPAQIAMVYWFAEHPRDPEIFAYSAAAFKDDGAYLGGLIDDIAAREAADFELTDEEWRCRYCPYRSLCERGAEAGPLDALDDEEALDEDDLTPGFDFDQVQEIEF